MQRILIPKRINWQDLIQERGLIFNSTQEPYWAEGVSYYFSNKEIAILESAANDIHKLCLQAVDYIITNNLFHRLHIPQIAIDLIKHSWQQQNPYLYGRFDFAFDGQSEPKLLEYNADTPTSLLETAVIQWDWLQATKPDYDQFNSLHEALIEAWKTLAYKEIYFSCLSDQAEDFITTEYLRDTAIQANLKTCFIDIANIGYDHKQQHFCDLYHNKINILFKLYPWEWMVQESFGAYLAKTDTQYIEPTWKMLLSNKAILPILWEIAPNHPNLLPAFNNHRHLPPNVNFIQKPIWGREGQNISLVTDAAIYQTPGIYENNPKIFQQHFSLPVFEGKYPICGLWMIGDNCHGLSIRESDTPITDHKSQFVPHFFGY